jgi:alpha-beta hydrolase superfamily lysophospholipase
MTPHLEGDHAAMSDGARLPLRMWQAAEPRAIVIGVHGHNNYSMEYEVFGPGPWLAGRGVTTYAYDQRGFGHAPDRGGWAGATRMARDLNELTRLLSEAHPGLPLYVLGQSMGGAVAILARTMPDAPKVEGLVLAAPAVMGWRSISFRRRVMMRAIALVKGRDLIPDTSAKAWRGTDNDALAEAFDADPVRLHATAYGVLPGLLDLTSAARSRAPRLADRTLYLFGLRDEAIRLAHVAPVVRAMRNASVPMTLACYPDGWHSILGGLNREIVWADLLTWLTSPGAPLPSGADTPERAAECSLSQ